MRNLVLGLVVTVVVGCAAKDDGSGGAGGTAGTSAGGAGASGSAGASGAGGSSSNGTVCPPDPKRNSCGRCVSDACEAMFCAPCDGDPACKQAWVENNKCVANLPPPSACSSNSQCPTVCLTTGKCSTSDDSGCLAPIRANANANALYQCIVDRIVPCSNMEACANPMP